MRMLGILPSFTALLISFSPIPIIGRLFFSSAAASLMVRICGRFPFPSKPRRRLMVGAIASASATRRCRGRCAKADLILPEPSKRIYRWLRKDQVLLFLKQCSGSFLFSTDHLSFSVRYNVGNQLRRATFGRIVGCEILLCGAYALVPEHRLDCFKIRAIICEKNTVRTLFCDLGALSAWGLPFSL